MTSPTSTVHTAHTTATQLIDSHMAASTPLPVSPPNGLLHVQPTSPPPASFKPPKLITETWSGQSYDFYPWLSSILNRFNLTKCADPVKLMLTLQAIPLNKKGPFNNISNWNEFKIKLIDKSGSIDIFGRDVNQIFNLLPGMNQSKKSPRTCPLRSKLFKPNWKSCNSSITWRTSTALPSPRPSSSTS